MFIVSSCSCLCAIHRSQVLSWEWRCGWSSADKRCSNYIWMINNFIAKVRLILEVWRSFLAHSCDLSLDVAETLCTDIGAGITTIIINHKPCDILETHSIASVAWLGIIIFNKAHWDRFTTKNGIEMKISHIKWGMTEGQCSNNNIHTPVLFFVLILSIPSD